MSEGKSTNIGDFLSGFGIDPTTAAIAPSAAHRHNRTELSLADQGLLIVEGGRNNALTSIAGKMRRIGATREEIRDGLRVVNETTVDPPLAETEVESIAASVSHYEPSPVGQLLSTLNDVGNAHRFVARYGSLLRYIPQRDNWLCWLDGRWRWDDTKKVVEGAKACARELQLHAETIADESARKPVRKFANQSLNLARLQAAVATASSDDAVVVSVNQLDPEPMYFGVANGYVDLRYGSFHAPDPSLLIANYSPAMYEAGAECPTFLTFLNQVMAGDADMVAFLQRFAGYALTGRIDEQKMLFLYGGGSNGKSTFINTLLKLLGEYGTQASQGLLVARRQPRAQTNDLARLNKKRLVVSSEVDEGSFLDEALVKDMTGGEAITARFLFGEFIEFNPEFKLVMCGNHRPVIRNHDDGIWRRMVLVPFEVTIASEQRDPELAAKLEGELPGILNWAIEGAIAWQKTGLGVPEKVTKASAAYREDMDVLADWIAERCEVGDNLSGKASELWSDFKFWLLANPSVELKPPSFAAKLAERFTKKRTSGCNVYCGIALKPSPPCIGIAPRARIELPAQAARPAAKVEGENIAKTGAAASRRGRPLAVVSDVGV